MIRTLLKGAALAAVGLALMSAEAHAGGAIGWTTGMTEFSNEAIAVGALATIMGIVAVGLILSFGITGLLTTVVMFTLGGALASNAQTVQGIFGGGGGGGGSIHSVVSAPLDPAS